MKHIISSLFRYLGRNLILCDVGARWGIQPPWSYFSPLLEVIGFEPDEAEYKRLVEKGQKGRIFNYALYERSQQVRLNLTKVRGCSSIYEPNFDLLKNYDAVGEYVVEDIASVKAVSLDKFTQEENIGDIDFIKIDVQGAELDVLKGGRRFIADHILGMELEVEFQQMYRNQPLFADLDIFIRNEFELDLQDLKKYYWKYPEGLRYGSSKGTLIFGEALYFRTPDNVLKLCERKSGQDARNKLMMAVFMGIIYGFLDYSLAVLNRPKVKDYFEKSHITGLENVIKSYGKGLRYTRTLAPRLSELFRLLYRLFQPMQDGRASIGQPLGARKKLRTFY